MLHTLSLGSALGILWLLLSGIFEAWLLALGLGSTVVVIIFANRMDVIDHEGHPIHISWRAMLYWPWLAWEIVKANIDVARVILDPKMPITPKVLNINTLQVTELGHVFYANSITLTPGTVTLGLENGALEVHALTPAAIEGLLSGEMDRRVHAVEGFADGTVENT
ncbi:MAG: Na+/H+ antiporter subunit E [Rhodospirillales bacterium]|nr:Na+/H+ antiporter subunit E [Rhodospirillales bacterium]